MIWIHLDQFGAVCVALLCQGLLILFEHNYTEAKVSSGVVWARAQAQAQIQSFCCLIVSMLP